MELISSSIGVATSPASHKVACSLVHHNALILPMFIIPGKKLAFKNIVYQPPTIRKSGLNECGKKHVVLDRNTMSRQSSKSFLKAIDINTAILNHFKYFCLN